LYWYLKGHTDYLNSLGRGATFKEISKSIVENIEIPLPDLEKQIDCANTLKKCWDLMLLRKVQIKQMDNLIKSRFVEMFGDPMVNSMGWLIKSFEDVSCIITDGEHATPKRATEGIYLLSARNILDHAIQLDDVDFIDDKEYERIAKRIVPRTGDVLLSCSGSIGRCCVVPENLKFQMVRSVALIRFNDNEVNPIFAEWLITTDEVQRQILKLATQSSQTNLFQGKIKKLRGYIPPLKLQNQFADFVTQTTKLKFEIQKSLDETQTLMDTLMQEYFG
ncbi:MAG: restriction endonuclease subunit S, partial [Lachnospiraceae bacterium]|nr:restriction endonuclease subunit S [Lachnospiraceae bacterium]